MGYLDRKKTFYIKKSWDKIPTKPNFFLKAPLKMCNTSAATCRIYKLKAMCYRNFLFRKTQMLGQSSPPFTSTVAPFMYLKHRILLSFYFLSSIGDLDTHTLQLIVTFSLRVLFYLISKSNPRDLWPLRELIRVIRNMTWPTFWQFVTILWQLWNVLNFLLHFWQSVTICIGPMCTWDPIYGSWCLY